MAESMFLGSLLTEKNGRKMTSVLEKANHEDLLVLKDLMEGGKIKPIIDGSYPLSETVEAFRYFAKGHTHGKVVITIGKQE